MTYSGNSGMAAGFVEAAGFRVIDPMSAAQVEFLSLYRLPATLSGLQTCWRLGFDMNHLQRAVRAKKILPSGTWREGGYYFDMAEVEQKAGDRLWLKDLTAWLQNVDATKDIVRQPSDDDAKGSINYTDPDKLLAPGPCLSGEARDLLRIRFLPARLISRQVSSLLLFCEDYIPWLVEEHFLHPLGATSGTCSKVFWAQEVEESRRNPRWMEQVRSVIRRNNESKNRSRANP